MSHALILQPSQLYCSAVRRKSPRLGHAHPIRTPSAAVVMGLADAIPHLQDEGCVYMDYNATTPIFPEVSQAMEPYLRLHFGWGYSRNMLSRLRANCQAAIQTARRQVADMIGAQAHEIHFTASGTESDHWAVWGARAAKRRALEAHQTPHVVSSTIEHPAVLQYLNALRHENLITTSLVAVDDDGLIDSQNVQSALLDTTCLVSIMHSNNEVGCLQPITDIVQLARQQNVLVHSDAAQSIGKVKVDVKELGVDMLTIVGHKFGAPKGVAALYIRDGVQLDNFFHGGGQEAGRRAGTENVLGIVGLGAAAEIVIREQAATETHMAAMRDDLQERLLRAFPEGTVRVNGPKQAAQRLPNTLSISIKGLRASDLLMSLADELAASAGAACHSGREATVSSVLQAMQVPREYALGTLRLSTGRHTIKQDVIKAAELIIAGAKKQGVQVI